MDNDLQEAESHRYSDLAFYVLPLESGKIAILGPRREFFKIVDTWEEAKIEGPNASPRYVQTYNPRPRKSRRRDAAMLERLNILTDAAQNIILNAEKVPDPRSDGATDCYLIPLEDLEALKNILMPDAEPGEQALATEETDQAELI